jgi:predicted nucleotidyltransferase
MLTDSDWQLAERLKHALIEHNISLYKAIVFGSRARGDAQPDSDLDVLVLVEHVTPTIRKIISHCAWEVGFEAGVLIQPASGAASHDSIRNRRVHFCL